MIIAQFYYKGMECIGSDNYIPIDGRLNLLHMREYVHRHPHTQFLKNNKRATHFKIIKTDSLLNSGHDLTNFLAL